METKVDGNKPADETKLLMFPGEGAYKDPDVVSSSSSWGSHGLQKRKRNQVAAEVVTIADEEDGMAIIGESSMNSKNKEPVEYDTAYLENEEEFIASLMYHDSGNDASMDFLNNLKAEEEDYGYPSYYEDDEYEENDTEEYDYSMVEGDSYSNLASQFDDLDLPPGVEATVPWLQNLPSEKGTHKKILTDFEIEAKFKSFKQFDTIQDHSDHYYVKNEKGISLVNKPPKDWAKRIHHEWKVLEKDLPGTIFVRVYEDRMDLLRAAIIGPAGTPYHDGLFFFDVIFPSTYPNTPPLVYYHSGGLRLNPNLYNNGKVCLSLLGTWTGAGCETWNPQKSTMLQVLVSIQALVLNEKPYFNEPGYASSAGTSGGEMRSVAYNEEAFLLSCKTMLYTLKRPPKNFEDFVAGHFHDHGRTILIACLAYLNGVRVGSTLDGEVPDVDMNENLPWSPFQTSLKKLYEELLMEFTVKGANCEAFLAKKIKAGLVKPAEIMPPL